MKRVTQIQIVKKLFLALSFIGIFLLTPSSHVFALTITPIRLEISGDPGKVLSQEMTLINERDTPETYYSSFANFEAQGETGSPSFVDAKEDLGTWMSAPESIVLPPGASKIVQIKITIPAAADPGGHFAAVFWGTTPTNSLPGSVVIGAKTGMLVLLRVNGPVNENGGILDFATKNKQTFYTALPVTFQYRFQNSGNDRIKPTGDVGMKNMLGMMSAKILANPVEGNILPNSIRKFETVWQGKDGPVMPDEKDQGNFFTKVGYEWRNFAFGKYSANLMLSYGTKNQVATALFSFWVFPWHLISFVLLTLVLIFFGGRTLMRRYNHWVIAQAEKMLRREQDQKTHDTQPPTQM